LPESHRWLQRYRASQQSKYLAPSHAITSLW
jgi:hypothetical protein